MEKISISENFRTFDKYWQSKVVSRLNNQSVKLVKLRGEFDWHHHQSEDELYLVLKGKLTLRFRNKTIELNEGEFSVISKGTEHQIIASDEVQLMGIEPQSTLNSTAEESKPDPAASTAAKGGK
ncbi:MAG: hypothetical protein BWK80_35860 [Desulfobacteraceae bacterium IS3]|nr:MAG: hypothetical protein BWK80_35860 [Desulfobacteraceae bacterium IS3]HAO19098.1 cupin domain-containing protein [Desulfobacteraceae bacterium]